MDMKFKKSYIVIAIVTGLTLFTLKNYMNRLSVSGNVKQENGECIQQNTQGGAPDSTQNTGDQTEYKVIGLYFYCNRLIVAVILLDGTVSIGPSLCSVSVSVAGTKCSFS